MSEPILDFAEVFRLQGQWVSAVGMEELERQARAYAERRVAEAVAPYQALVEKVREYVDSRGAPEGNDEGVSEILAFEELAAALDALPHPEAPCP